MSSHDPNTLRRLHGTLAARNNATTDSGMVVATLMVICFLVAVVALITRFT